MRHYQFDLPTALRFRELIDEYGRMRRLEDTTLQRRGQQFNHFIAELLGNWGTDRVQVNVRGVGEIDVAFAVDGTRFLLEAKWEKEPVSFDPTPSFLDGSPSGLVVRGAYSSLYPAIRSMR